MLGLWHCRPMAILLAFIFLGKSAGFSSTPVLSTETQTHTYTPLQASEVRWPALHERRESQVSRHDTWSVEKSGDVVDEVMRRCKVSQADALELIDIGAVYVGSGDPIKWHRGCLGRRDTQVTVGMSVKTYASPARFTALYEAKDWEHRLKYCCSSYVAIDKPPGVLVQPHASNYKEALPTAVAEMFGVGHLSIVHRLDACASGLVILARNTKVQAHLTGAFAKRQVTKRYKALVRAPIAPGEYTHWHDAESPLVQLLKEYTSSEEHSSPELSAENSSAAPKAAVRWKEARLIVLECNPLVNLHASAGELYELEIELLTGRKHQIRAQLSALGSPIVGDTLYTPIAGLCLAPLDGVDSLEKHIKNSNTLEKDVESSEKKRELLALCKPPISSLRTAIGLQASFILLPGAQEKPILAGVPWWREEGSVDKYEALRIT